jgi:hypothetical protein
LFGLEARVLNCGFLCSRWKGDKGGLSSICMFEDMLLVAGRKMTLWNLETKTSVMTFMGHTSISQLEPIPNTDYFATMSVREMHLQIWYDPSHLF